MIEVKPLKAEDILYVIEHGVKEVRLKAEPTDDMIELAIEREESGKCFTAVVDNVIVGVGGIDELWKGVANIWLMVTPYINNHVREGYICIRKGMKKLLKENNLRRVQSYGRVDYPECHILFKHLGFEVEGLAKGYCPDGCDAIMYAKVKND